MHSAGGNVGLEDREAREISFKKIKAIRDKLIHRAEDSQPRFRHVPVAAANQLNSPQRTQEAVQSRKRQGEIFRLVDPEMQCENMHIDAAPFILQFITPTLQVAAFTIASPVDKTQDPGGQKTHGTRGALKRSKNMKKYLLLPLVALGLVTWLPNQAKAGVHVTFGFGVPTYYGYYPGYTYYYQPYWYHRHHYYRHHYYWHRW